MPVFRVSQRHKLRRILLNPKGERWKHRERAEKAVAELGELRDPQVIKWLLKALAMPEYEHEMSVNNALVKALIKTGPAAVPPLISALKHNNRGVRSGAVKALGGLGDVRAVEPIAALLHDDDQYNDEAKWFHFEIVRALGQTGDPVAFEHLRRILDWHDSDFKKSVIYALGEIKDPRSVTVLKDIISRSSRGGELRQAALRALGDLHEDGIQVDKALLLDKLLTDLKHKYEKIRLAAVSAIHGLRDPRAVEGLIDVIRRDPKVRTKARDALPSCCALPALRSLTDALADDNPHVRSAAASALGVINDHTVVGHLVNALQDKAKDVRVAAAESLGKIGDSTAIHPLLMQTLQQDTSSHEYEQGCKSILTLAAKTGHDEAPSFQNLLGGPHTVLAALALDRMGAPSAIDALILAAKQTVRKTLGPYYSSDQLLSAIYDHQPLESSQALEELLSDLLRLTNEGKPKTRLNAVHKLGYIAPSTFHDVKTALLDLLDDRTPFEYTVSTPTGWVETLPGGDIRASTEEHTVIDYDIANAAAEALGRIFKGTKDPDVVDEILSRNTTKKEEWALALITGWPFSKDYRSFKAGLKWWKKNRKLNFKDDLTRKP